MIKTNIKMRVTPEQSVKVQKICFNREIEWVSGEINAIYTNEPFIFISSEKDLRWMGKDRESIFIKAKEKEIDADLFIRTNGTCIENNSKGESNYDVVDWNYKESEDIAQTILKFEGKSMTDFIEFIKKTKEYSKYIQAKKYLKDVSKGGKDYHSCSLMDIRLRDDRFKARKKKLIKYIGKLILDKIIKE